MYVVKLYDVSGRRSKREVLYVTFFYIKILLAKEDGVQDDHHREDYWSPPRHANGRHHSILKQAEDDLQVLRLDVSGLKSSRDSFPDHTVSTCPKGFCLATVQGTQSAVSRLSGCMLHNTPVAVTVLSVTSRMPDSECDSDPFSNLKGVHRQRKGHTMTVYVQMPRRLRPSSARQTKHHASSFKTCRTR